MPETPDLTQLATSFVPLIQRFTGNQPDALAQLRRQIENERNGGKQMMERAEAQLAALDQLEALIAEGEPPENGGLTPAAPFPAPPLKIAFLSFMRRSSGEGGVLAVKIRATRSPAGCAISSAKSA